MRGTLIKSMIYLIVLCLAFAIETVIGWGFLYKVLFGIASLIELYSVTANLLIIEPNMPFLKIFRKLIKDELGKKIKDNE